VGNVDFPALVLQGHPNQIRKRPLVVDEQNPDRRSVGTVHPWQLAEEGTTRALVAHRHGRHSTILAILQRAVTNLIDISNVASDLLLRPIGWVESPATDPSLASRQADEGTPGCRLVLHPDVRPALRVHPRGDPSRSMRGVFVTRSQLQPNPLGIHPGQHR
jgi:hypothetical protein